MNICKATIPILRLKALNMHNMTDKIYIETENSYQQFNKTLTHNVDINKGWSITMVRMHTHTHTHTHTEQDLINPTCINLPLLTLCTMDPTHNLKVLFSGSNTHIAGSIEPEQQRDCTFAPIGRKHCDMGPTHNLEWMNMTLYIYREREREGNYVQICNSEQNVENTVLYVPCNQQSMIMAKLGTHTVLFLFAKMKTLTKAKLWLRGSSF